MHDTTETPTPINLLSSMAAALDTSDPMVLAEAFARMGEEALALCEAAPSARMREFWLELSEDFQWEARAVLVGAA